jgi:hypothetical protein
VATATPQPPPDVYGLGKSFQNREIKRQKRLGFINSDYKPRLKSFKA